MSAAHRHQSCSCCGQYIRENDPVTVEALVQIDSPVIYIPVLLGHSTFSSHPTWVLEGGTYVRGNRTS